ncbi:hypothetical protein ACVW16_001256 [Bradyrhizobium sp. USDA 4474]
MRQDYFKQAAAHQTKIEAPSGWLITLFWASSGRDVLGVDGISDFSGLHSRKHDHEVQLFAFDILGLGGDDLRWLSLMETEPGAARAG